jgi:hypothetical protein
VFEEVFSLTARTDSSAKAPRFISKVKPVAKAIATALAKHLERKPKFIVVYPVDRENVSLRKIPILFIP